VSGGEIEALTGWPDGPPLPPPPSLLPRVRAAVAMLAGLTATFGRPVTVDPVALLTGRAARLGLGRRGRTSAGGRCRLLPAGDGGWVAISLARPTDVEAVPALVGGPVGEDPWAALVEFAAGQPAAEVAGRAQLVGVAAAVLGEAAPRPFRITPVGPPRPEPAAAGDLTVVDLSALWAGPLCAGLLAEAGCRVVKVATPARPDPAAAVTLDPATPAGLGRLRRLLATADVVIEASRPRALEQLGIVAAEVVASRPGVTWVGITGYGRRSNRIAFGDDAAVAGGLVALDRDGLPVFCADAIADPLTGLHAALAAAISLAAGGGHLVDVAMAGVAAWVAAPRP
jgi:CoA-transferase family III